MSVILCIWDRMGDYHRARIRALRSIEGKVISADLGSSDQLYQWESGADENHFILSEKSLDQSDLMKRLLAFRRLIKKEKVTTVGLAGYGRTEYLLMMIYAQLKGIRVIMFSESWYSRGGLLDKLKGFLIKRIADRFFVSGERARNHLVDKLGVKSERILTGYSTVDNHHFKNDSPDYSSKILLCMARFSPEKNLHNLIESFNSSSLSEDWKLCLVGGGPQRNELQTTAGEKNVEIQEWVQYARLPEYYGKASAFILPSKFEPWGLVVNEAMAASLPVWVSEQSGCVSDLVDETNGMTFDANHKPSMTEALNTMAKLDEATLRRMGEASKKKIKDYGTETWAQNFIKLAK